MTSVVVGRFQVPQLTAGHIALLTKAARSGDRLLVLIGVAPTRGTQRDPLDFAAREAMIVQWYENWYTPTDPAAHSPDLAVLPLLDRAEHGQWVKGVDRAIAMLAGPATLYGGRDSCGSCYRLHGGHWPFVEIEMVDPLSGTEVRARLLAQPRSSDFRAGMIYASQHKFQTVYPTVDVAIYRGGEVLLARKADDTRWRLPGGFVDPTDHSLEYAATREAREETGLEIGQPVYVCSSLIPDWRYIKGPEQIMSSLFAAQYVFGYPQAHDDIAEVKWVSRADAAAIITAEHAGLWVMAKQYLDEHDTMVRLTEMAAEIDRGNLAGPNE